MKLKLFALPFVVVLLMIITSSPEVVSCKCIALKERQHSLNGVKLDKYVSFDLDNEDYTEFIYKDYKLYCSRKDSAFILSKNEQYLGQIDFLEQDKRYDGPGYDISMFYSDKTTYSVLFIEAMGDPVTAWYYAVLLHNDQIQKIVCIEEPRANSEVTNTDDFINMFIDDKKWIIRFDTRFVMSSSYIPDSLETTKNYAFMKFKL